MYDQLQLQLDLGIILYRCGKDEMQGFFALRRYDDNAMIILPDYEKGGFKHRLFEKRGNAAIEIDLSCVNPQHGIGAHILKMMVIIDENNMKVVK